MQRRLALPLLAVGIAVVLAGCAHPAGMLDLDPVNDTQLADRASHETTGADLYHSIEEQRTARRIIENGTLRLTGVHQPLRTALPYEYRGAYYNLTAEVVDRVPGAVVQIGVDFNGSASNATTVDFADLSATDRRKLGTVFANRPSYISEGPDAETLFSYTESTRDASVLLDHGGERLVVRYEGSRYVVEVGMVNDDTLRVTRYESTLVAANTSAYARQLTETYAFTLSNLDEGERDVVEKAIEETYYAGDVDDASFDSLVDRIRHHRAVEGGATEGSWVVRYDGHRYWAEMHYGGFVQDDTSSSTTPQVTPH